jgi:FAD/FMN-containing dehydrogenase
LKKITNYIFKLSLKLKGSIAAEHGLGIKKNELIQKYKSKEYIKFLTNYKKHLDPKLILGKGKLFKTP